MSGGTSDDDVRIGGAFTGNFVGGSGNRVRGMTFTGQQAPPARPERPVRAGRSHRLGFVVDVVSYGRRTAPAQERIQSRLKDLLRAVVADVGAEFDGTDGDINDDINGASNGDINGVDHDGGSGDGTVVFLPSGEDPTILLPGLLRAMAERLAADNEEYRDRVRLRMAVGSGLVGQGANGFTGPLVVNISRLVDSEPLRAAVRDNPAADLAVLVLDALHREVVVPGYVPLRTAEFEVVDVELKEFTERAWLWVSAPAQGL